MTSASCLTSATFFKVLQSRLKLAKYCRSVKRLVSGWDAE